MSKEAILTNLILSIHRVVGFDLGVTGAPETYLVDAQGVIQYRRVGVVDQRVWDDEFKTLYNQLMDEEK